MDILDNLIYTTHNNTVKERLDSDLIFLPRLATSQPGAGLTSYSIDDRRNYVHLTDPTLHEKAFEKHWFDIKEGGAPYTSYLDGKTVTDLSENPVYQLIYPYFIENTRITQIFEKVISLYVQGEVLGITGDNNIDAFNWMMNTEYLFFKHSDSRHLRNITSSLRPDFESVRRNAYFRMFGMDLAFGNSNNTAGSNGKPLASNSQFIILFEQFLSEIWQAYSNIRNTSGANTTDFNNIGDLARKIGEVLRARRGGAFSTNYASKNLSREEYSACFLSSWFHFIVSYDSPVVNFLRCQGVSEGDRLSKIGAKVGIPCHSKAQALFDLAAPSASILKLMEDPSGVFNDAATLEIIISNKNDTRDDLLIVINNWEKATGHKIKNRESNINGTVRVAQMARAASLVTN
jgi:hypothetical protein